MLKTRLQVLEELHAEHLTSLLSNEVLMNSIKEMTETEVITQRDRLGMETAQTVKVLRKNLGEAILRFNKKIQTIEAMIEEEKQKEANTAPILQREG